MTNKILTVILMCLPVIGWADVDVSAISNAKDTTELNSAANTALDELSAEYADELSKEEIDEIIEDARGQLKSSSASNSQTSESDKKDNSDAQSKIDAAQKALDAAKEKEQSTANRMLGGLSTLATGIGGMQLAQGIAEKQADKAANKDMDAYIETMRCEYGDGKSVKFSVEPVELPGGNDSDFMKYRAEYVALAASLKERKTALDMKPGIEAEEILDKANMGLYDDENVGVTGGLYASRYRATAGSEKDEKGLKSDSKEAKNRMIAGGVIAGVGVVGGIVGNSIINGKLGELIKESRANRQKSKDHNATVKSIKQALKDKGYTNVDSLNFDNVDVGALKDADWSKLQSATSGNRDAKSLISTANAKSLTSSLKDLGLKGSEDE